MNCILHLDAILGWKQTICFVPFSKIYRITSNILCYGDSISLLSFIYNSTFQNHLETESFVNKTISHFFTERKSHTNKG